MAASSQARTKGEQVTRVLAKTNGKYPQRGDLGQPIPMPGLGHITFRKSPERAPRPVRPEVSPVGQSLFWPDQLIVLGAGYILRGLPSSTRP
jgi:hypothetical protein